MAEYVLKLGGLVALGLAFALARSGVETAGSVPDGRLFFGRSIPLALDGAQVQYLRPRHILDVVQFVDDIDDVVAVDRPEVAYVEPLEYVLLLGKQCLQAVVEAQYRAAVLLVDEVQLAQRAVGVVAQLVVAPRGGDVYQIFVQPAHVMVDGHVVVVEDDEQVVGVDRGVVQPLEGQTAGNGGVADDGNHLALLLLVFQPGGDGHTQCGRYGVGGMSGDEGVVFALGRVGETAQPVQLAAGVEPLASAGQYLVAVGLVPHVPYDAVVGGVEHVVQGYGQLDGSHARPEMPRVVGQRTDEEAAYLGTHLGQLLDRQFA